MVTPTLLVLILGLVLYVVSSDKTRRQLCEDIGPDAILRCGVGDIDCLRI